MCELIIGTLVVVVIVTVVICSHIDKVAHEVRRLSDIIEKDIEERNMRFGRRP